MPIMSIRLSDEEIQRFKAAKKRLEERGDPKYPTTDRVTLLEALERLETYLDKLDRDKKRQR